MTAQSDHPETELTEGDLDKAADPLALFAQWLAEAEKSEPNDPTAMALATVDPGGLPNVRMVLLKGFGADGFTFFTNTASAKGRELAGNPQGALCFHWKSLRRQVRIRGLVAPISAGEADAYFDTRPRMSRIGAWASRQSEPLESRFALEKAVARETARFPVGAIPRPETWSGYRVQPQTIEFWRDGAFRLHDRVMFRREAGGWSRQRLYP